MKLEVIEIAPEPRENPPKASVIWLHGLGADGHDFVPIAQEMRIPRDLGIRFVFPHAPIRPVTLNGGMLMRAWCDIEAIDLYQPLDQKGIAEIVAAIESLIEHEQTLNIPSDKVLLAGFSQGGAVALHCGLRFRKRLAGIMCLSGFLAMFDTLIDQAAPENRQTPVFLAHGEYDPIVPYHFGTKTRDHLLSLDYPVTWKSYDMEHNVCETEIQDISRWIQSVYLR